MASLKPLLGYIEILSNEYPKPITQTELANKSSKSKSAITKIKDRLFDICDKDILAFQRKMVLKTDFETFGKLFTLFLLESRIQDLLKSKYVENVIKQIELHKKLTKQFRKFSYSKYFTEEDTDWMVTIVLRNVCAFEFQKDMLGAVLYALKGYEIENIRELVPYIQLFGRLLLNFEVVFEGEDELKRTLKLRDKLFFFIIENADEFLVEFEIIKNLKNPQKKLQYLEVYSETIRYFLTDFAQKITNGIQEKCKEKNIPFQTNYNEIGAFFGGLKKIEVAVAMQQVGKAGKKKQEMKATHSRVC